MATNDFIAQGKNFQTANVGFKGVATAGQTTYIRHQIVDNAKYFAGIECILRNHDFDDIAEVCLQAPDGQGGYVTIREFSPGWNIKSDVQGQGIIKTGYWGEVPVGIYLVIKYTSVGTTDVDVKINLFMHEDI